MSVIDIAERKRLQSLKEKKQIFQEREQIIQKALANIHNTTSNKKIIFDDDCNEQQNPKPEEKKKINLFDDDDDGNDSNEDPLWNENIFNIKKQITLGHDARFTLDERFAEDNHRNETEVIADAVECDLQKEKEKEIGILENVLGAPLTMKSQKTKTSKKGLMIRYNPTENKHCEYEIKPLQPNTKEKSTKKNKREKAKIEETVPVEVSKDIYYTVSDSLAESLKQNEGFSLLKACGREQSDRNVDDRNVENCNTENSGISITKNDNMDGQFRFHFSAKNAFKHDSFEDTNETFNVNEQVVEQSENDNRTNSLFDYKNSLFFESEDVRFNEAVKFFNETSLEKNFNEEFKNFRPKLREIIRAKVRRNGRRAKCHGSQSSRYLKQSQTEKRK